MSLMAASPGYLRAMRIPLRAGRALTEHDAIEGLNLVVINEAAAKRYWTGQDPLGAPGPIQPSSGTALPRGRRHRRHQERWTRKSDRAGGSSARLNPADRIDHFAVRSARPAASLMPDITRVISSIDPEQPIHDVATMREIIRRTITPERVTSFMTAFSGGAA